MRTSYKLHVLELRFPTRYDLSSETNMKQTLSSLSENRNDGQKRSVGSTPLQNCNDKFNVEYNNAKYKVTPL